MTTIKGIDLTARLRQIERMGVFTPRETAGGARHIDRILTSGTERFDSLASLPKITVYNLSCLLGLETDILRAGIDPDSFSYELENRPMYSGEIHERFFRGYPVNNGASWSRSGSMDLKQCLTRTGFAPIVSGADVLALCGGYGFGLLKVDPFFSSSNMVLLDANADNISRAIDIFDMGSYGIIAEEEPGLRCSTEITAAGIISPLPLSADQSLNMISTDFQGYFDAVKAFRERTSAPNTYRLCLSDARAGFHGVPFEDETFNVILMLGDSEFAMSLDDMSRLMFEAVRVLNRERGVFIIESNHMSRYANALQNISDRFPAFRLGLVPLAGNVDANMTVAVVGMDHFNNNMR